MKKLGKHKESREGKDIYSDSDYEDKMDNKEELIEEKGICEEQSKDNLTPEGGDVCDSEDQESNDKNKEELVQKQDENCEDESKENSTGIICELDVGEGIRIEIHEKMEELVCNITAQEHKEPVIKEEKAKEEFNGQYKELLTRQAFICMGPIYENLIQEVVNEAVTETLDEDETVQKLKDLIESKKNKTRILYSRL